jgi:hypothetical protein
MATFSVQIDCREMTSEAFEAYSGAPVPAWLDPCAVDSDSIDRWMVTADSAAECKRLVWDHLEAIGPKGGGALLLAIREMTDDTIPLWDEVGPDGLKRVRAAELATARL